MRNGIPMNGVRMATKRKGFLCLEAEGAAIEFKNLSLIALDEGFIEADHIVKPL